MKTRCIRPKAYILSIPFIWVLDDFWRGIYSISEAIEEIFVIKESGLVKTCNLFMILSTRVCLVPKLPLQEQMRIANATRINFNMIK